MIKNPKRFSQAQPANFDGVFDWDFLIPAFVGTKIEPTDIDAMVKGIAEYYFSKRKNLVGKYPKGRLLH